MADFLGAVGFAWPHGSLLGDMTTQSIMTTANIIADGLETTRHLFGKPENDGGILSEEVDGALFLLYISVFDGIPLYATHI